MPPSSSVRVAGVPLAAAAAVAVPLALSAAAGGTARAHDWYGGLTSPAGERCCSDRDCRSVALRRDSTGGVEVAIEGRWVRVDASALLAAPTPDGGAHACYRRLLVFGVEILRIRCVILPKGS